MSYALAVSKYSAAVNASEVFKIDFAGAIPSNPSTIFFLNDFLSPETVVESNKIQSSETIFKLNGQHELKIVKDYTNKTVKYFKNGSEDVSSFFKIISAAVGKEVDISSWSKLVLDCVKNNIENSDQLKLILNPQGSSSNDELETLLKQAEEGLTEDEKKKLNKLRESDLKISLMDKEVSSYQNQKKNKEDLKKNKDKIESDIKTLEEKLASVNMLIESQKRLKSELEKFSSITADTSIGHKVQKIKEVRAQSLYSNLRTVKRPAAINMESEESEKPLLVAKWMIALVVVELVVSLSLFVISFQFIQLLIGLFSAATILILMLLVNVSRFTNEYKGRFNESMPTGSVQVLKQNNNPDEDKLMLNNAWSKALEGELKVVNDSMEARLGGKSLDEMIQEKEKLLSDKKALEEQTTASETGTTTTEEYYKKRRELDILKIEKENIEFSLEGKIKKELEAQIAQIKKSSETTTISENLPLLLLNCKFLDQIQELVESLKKQRQVVLINFGL